jgi:hypothetical protein
MKRTTAMCMALLIAAACSNKSSTVATQTAATVAATTAVVAPTTAAPTTTEATTTTLAPTTTVAPTTTTTIDPMELARTNYFVIASESNAVSTGLGPAAQSRSYCQTLAPVVEKFAKDLRATKWPADVQKEIDALVAVSAAEAGDLYSCANAKSDYDAGLVPIRGVSAEASAVRLALGLPINRT